jgi:uncharacterized protein (TIGR02246 family)
MKNVLLISSVLLLTIMSCQNGSQKVNETSEAEKDKIYKVIAAYEKGLNDPDTEAIVNLYTSDGVFMFQNHEPTVGADSLREIYHTIFTKMKMDMKLKIHDMQISGDLAYVYSTSEGKVKVLANGSEIIGKGQELFALRKTENKDWKIAVYSTSNRLPLGTFEKQ